MVALDKSLKTCIPALLALLDTPSGDSEWEKLDPQLRREKTHEAVKRLLLRSSQVQPLLVVLEDLHGIDSETQAILNNLVDSLALARMLLLVSYRPEYLHDWHAKPYYTQVRLGPLEADGTEDLLDALLGRDATLLPLKRLLAERTAGNPFFLEESVRSLAESKALVGAPGAYRFAGSLTTIQVPTTCNPSSPSASTAFRRCTSSCSRPQPSLAPAFPLRCSTQSSSSRTDAAAGPGTPPIRRLPA